MPNFTTHLQLEKPTPEEFYDIGVQNGNMDKIDEDLTKRVPQTRTINKKPLSADVTLTGEDIPVGAKDEKTLSSHLAECQKALENKQDSIWLGIAEKDVDLNTLTQIGTIAIHGTSANVPPDVITTNWGLLSISANSKDGKAACTQHLSIMVSEGHFPNVYERNWNGINWSKWARIATATPPEEIPLQLAEGLQPLPNLGSNTLSKNQFREVTLQISVTKTSVETNDIANESVLCTLPAGFRPAHVISGACYADRFNADLMPSFISVYSDGTVRVFLARPASCSVVIASISFIATA